MANKSQVAATLFGAALGALAGYMFFTESGRALRRRLEPALEDLAGDLSRLRKTILKTAEVAGGGWKLLTDMASEQESNIRRRHDIRR